MDNKQNDWDEKLWPEPMSNKDTLSLTLACAAAAVVFVGFAWLCALGIVHLLNCGYRY